MSAQSQSLPLNLPQSALLDAIRDDSILAALLKEEELRQTRQQLRNELRALQDARNKQQRDQRPKDEKVRQEQSKKLEELHREKEACYAELDKLKSEQAEIGDAKDAVRGIAFDLSILNKEMNDANMLLRDERREMERLTQGGSDAKTLAVQQEKIDKFEAIHTAKVSAQKEKEEKINAARSKLDGLKGGLEPEQRNEKFTSIRNHITEIQNEIKQLRGEQQKSRGGATGSSSEETAVRKSLDQVEGEIKSLRQDQIPFLYFNYDPNSKRALLGRGGTTLRQLQYDFSVAVCVDNVDEGTGFILGPREACEACLKAIERIIADAKEQGQTKIISFDPSLKRQIIGAKGSQIDQFQKDSGAHLEVRENEVRITGTTAAVEDAEKSIKEFLDSFYTESISFPAKSINVVIGKGGSTIQRIEKATGVRSLRVDRDTSKVVAVGPRACVQEAMKQYKELLGDVQGGSHVIYADDNLIRSVVGPKGRTVRGIESETGARVSCEGTTITITGSPAAVEAATAQIEALKRNERKIQVDQSMHNFLTAEIVHVDGEKGEEEQVKDGKAWISPIEAIRLSTGCDQGTLLRSEGCVVFRGKSPNVAHAVTLLNQLLLRNTPHKMKVSYMEVLQGFLLRRSKESEDNVINQVLKSYSPIMRVDLDKAQHALFVTSVDAEMARAAANEYAKIIKELTEKHVRVLSHVPSYRMGQLIGPKGSTIRDLQEFTNTEIAVVKDLEQVQIFSREGDENALEEAVEEVRKILELDSEE